MPRRSKRMWSTMPASSGPCSSPGFTKPTSSQVPLSPPASRPSLDGSGPWQREGAGLSQTPQSASLLPAGLPGLQVSVLSGSCLPAAQ